MSLLIVLGLVVFAIRSKRFRGYFDRLPSAWWSHALLFVLKHPILTFLGLVELVLILQFQTTTGLRQILTFLVLLPTTICFVVALFMWWRNRGHLLERTARAQQAREYRNRMKQAGLEEIDVMDGWAFERRMEIHFETMGWIVLRTPGSGDFGADLVLTTPDQRRVVIQCKRYSGPVGKEAVEEVLRGKRHYHADLAMVVTNSYLTKGALNLAKENMVDVWDRDDLVKQLLDAKAEESFSRRGAESEGNFDQSSEDESIPECFQVLFFDRTDVTEEEVLRRYRKLSSVAHPDAGGSDAAFVRLQNAKDDCVEYLRVNQEEAYV